jgi:hypothetical protein
VRYKLLATDYDGTIAHDGVVDEQTLAALERWKAAGGILVMVTGREIPDLHKTFAHVARFHRVVAENGAAVLDPTAPGPVKLLAEPPPPGFVSRLQAAGVPLSVGHVIVATVVPHDHAMLAAIRESGLGWHLIYNKGSVMALPEGVTKATGLTAVLTELGVDAKDVVGVGDAENDHAFLQMCGLSAAVANALPAVKQMAGLVLNRPRGAGVEELIDGLLAQEPGA